LVEKNIEELWGEREGHWGRYLRKGRGNARESQYEGM